MINCINKRGKKCSDADGHSAAAIKSERPLAQRSCVPHRSPSHLADTKFSQNPLPWQKADLRLQACKDD